MSWTRLQYETALLSLLDATGSNRWSTTEYRNAFTLAFRREWRYVLDAYPTYRYALRTATTDSDGRIAVSALNGGAADTAERFYQVVGRYLYSGTTRYTLETPQDIASALANPTAWSGSKVWWRQGANLQLMPVESGLTVTVPVNHIPSAFSALSADGVAVDWIEDHDLLPVYSAAAYLASKGDAEIRATSDFAKIVDDLRNELLGEIASLTTGPKIIRASDSPSDWGG